LRRAYKRGRHPSDELLPTAPKDPRPKWFLDVLMLGAVRCPRKWSEIAIEGCAQLQASQHDQCAAVKCVFLGKGGMFMAEVDACKRAGIAPKTGPRGKLPIVP
jgi:hypothetical protein